MPAIDYTMDGLIADVKRMAAVPTNQSLFNESDFVHILSDDMKTVLVPIIMSVMEKYFVTHEDQTITGEDHYQIPSRAIGGKLKAVKTVGSDGKEYDVPQIDLTETSSTVPNVTELRTRGFRTEGNDVVLFPIDSFTGQTLRLYYFRRPNDLCQTSEAGKVVAITPATGEVQLDNVPTDWLTTDLFDAIQGKPPFATRSEDCAISAIAGYVLTFPTIPTGLAVGDYVALTCQSPIPQIPYDAFPLLTQRGVIQVLGTLSPASVQEATSEFQALVQVFLKMINPRVDDAPKKLVARKGIWRWKGR